MLSGCDWFDWWFQLKLCDRIWREKGVEGSSISGRLFVEREKALLMATGAEEIWCLGIHKDARVITLFLPIPATYSTHSACPLLANGFQHCSRCSPLLSCCVFAHQRRSIVVLCRFFHSDFSSFLMCLLLTSPVQSRFIVCSSSNYFGIQVIFGATNPLCLALMSIGWFMEEHNLLPWN